jgi:hypothetical protein
MSLGNPTTKKGKRKKKVEKKTKLNKAINIKTKEKNY